MNFHGAVACCGSSRSLLVNEYWPVPTGCMGTQIHWQCVGDLHGISGLLIAGAMLYFTLNVHLLFFCSKVNLSFNKQSTDITAASFDPAHLSNTCAGKLEEPQILAECHYRRETWVLSNRLWKRSNLFFSHLSKNVNIQSTWSPRTDCTLEQWDPETCVEGDAIKCQDLPYLWHT